MKKEEIRREVRSLVNKCIYINILDFIDVVYTYFEKKGVYEYKLIDNAINEFIDDVIVKNKWHESIEKNNNKVYY